jgi:putative DNA primase/helicase
MLAGEPGLGKSQLAAFLAAIVTTSGDWPNGEGSADLGSVIVLSAEDDAADTIIPRLTAAGADLSRVHIVSAVATDDHKGRRLFNLQTDLSSLEEAIAHLGDVRLVIIDPVSSYLGKVDR